MFTWPNNIFIRIRQFFVFFRDHLTVYWIFQRDHGCDSSCNKFYTLKQFVQFNMTIPKDISASLKEKTRRIFRLEKAGLWNLQCYNLCNFDGRAIITSSFVIVCFNPKGNIQTYVYGWKSSKEIFSENLTSRRKLMSQLNVIASV